MGVDGLNTVNLLTIQSLRKSNKNLDYIKNYLKSTGNSIIKDEEILDLQRLIKSIITTIKDECISIDGNIFNGYIIGYKIPNIGKEFDILRFGSRTIINIELKRFSSPKKILTQLERNKYYLEFLGKDLELYTYVSSEDKIYKLNDDKLIESNFTTLISDLLNQELEFPYSDYNINIDRKFDLKNYLVSPFNSPDKFVNGEYFLTNDQERIKNEIKKILGKNIETNIIGIKGAPGTGKTLLVYDIALELIKKSCNVLIIHSANLNSGQYELNSSHNFKIIPIKNFNNIINLKRYDLVIVDESQRISENQFNRLIDLAKKDDISIIFSFDPRQCLSNMEVKTDFENLIQKEVTTKIFTLSDKIRTNPELAQFIRCLFDRNQIREHKGISLLRNNLRIEYCSSTKKVLLLLEYLTQNDWKFLNCTSSLYNPEHPDRYRSIDNEVSHEVIGQEFDKVVIVLNEYNYIDENGLLQGYGTYYHPNGMVFQNITRTIRSLCIIVDQNIEMFNYCVKILNYYDN
jgi:DNA replication protein DnaC